MDIEYGNRKCDRRDCAANGIQMNNRLKECVCAAYRSALIVNITNQKSEGLLRRPSEHPQLFQHVVHTAIVHIPCAIKDLFNRRRHGNLEIVGVGDLSG